MQGKADAFDWKNVGGVTHFDFVISKDEEDGEIDQVGGARLSPLGLQGCAAVGGGADVRGGRGLLVR